MLKVLTIFGTRPEAIKLAPVVYALDAHPEIELIVCVTSQHREMLDSVLTFFSIKADFNLEVMVPNQPLNETLGKMISGLGGVVSKVSPDVVLVQGDTTTCLAGAVAAFNCGVPVGHVEAGLRTGSLDKPFPEEGNRQMVSRIANFHFAPTEASADNLRNENLIHKNIFVTGNTVIDALLLGLEIVGRNPDLSKIASLPFSITENSPKYILVTGHRRESFGEGFKGICLALKEIALSNPNIQIIYPVHLNPNVQQPVNAILGTVPNIWLIPPQPYSAFISLMRNSLFILTDSGGIQEEAPSLNKPVLIMRDVTERPEVVEAGAALLVGTSTAEIVSSANLLLSDEGKYNSMSKVTNPFGDGKASQRIVDCLTAHLQ